MKRVLFLLTIVLVAGAVMAQPKARRVQQQQQQQAEQQKKSGGSSSSTMSRRAQISFPTSLDVPEDVVWRRDIYRELDLTKDANGGLYYPVQPVGREMNLFTYIFKLVQNGYVPAYEYRLDGNEVFTDSAKVDFKTLLSDHSIFYEERDGKIHVDNSDIPSSEVTMYYLKECAYYDQGTATFHRKVVALCPIMFREDDFGDAEQKYPLFWVKYDDVAPYLSKQMIMTSDLNNAATMSVDDYFTTNQYQGKIYKTTNMLGRTLAQYCPTDSAMSAEQKRIEKELADFEKNIFGDQAKKDSLDSIAAADQKLTKKQRRANRRSGGSSVSSSKRRSSGGGGSSSSARVSVRRERH